jgi:hypothetical protein
MIIDGYSNLRMAFFDAGFSWVSALLKRIAVRIAN